MATNYSISEIFDFVRTVIFSEEKTVKSFMRKYKRTFGDDSDLFQFLRENEKEVQQIINDEKDSIARSKIDYTQFINF